MVLKVFRKNFADLFSTEILDAFSEKRVSFVSELNKNILELISVSVLTKVSEMT